MTSKDAVFRELKYELAGASGALSNLVAQDHITMDDRLEPESDRDVNDYPWIVFRRAVAPDNDFQQVVEVDVFEFEVVGLQTDADKGDDLLETISEALKTHFKGKRKTWGKFAEDGTPDANGGKKMSCSFNDLQEEMDDTLGEKIHVLTFRFAYAAT